MLIIFLFLPVSVGFDCGDDGFDGGYGGDILVFDFSSMIFVSTWMGGSMITLVLLFLDLVVTIAFVSEWMCVSMIISMLLLLLAIIMGTEEDSIGKFLGLH